MKILGLSGGHDANWSLTENGCIIGAYEKERYTRKRHAGGEVTALAAESINALNISVRDLGLIATSEPVHKELGSGLRVLAGRKYRHTTDWQHQIVELFGTVYPAVSVPHHLSHAAYAVYTSPFENCVAVTLDGGGDHFTEEAYTCASVSVWKNGKLEFLEPIPNVGFGSLWFTYSRALFGNGDHSGKLMGLAAYGDDALNEELYDRFTAPITGLFGGTRAIKDCWPDYEDPPFVRGITSWTNPMAQRIARAIQNATNRCGTDLLRAVYKATGEQNLVLSGGVALNGYLTTAIRNADIFKGIHVPPAVHDGGISLGANLFVSHHLLDHPRTPHTPEEIAFVGQEYDVTAELDHANGITILRMDVEEAASTCAEFLVQGKLVAIYEGRSEHGPRALGNRSLISNASLPGLRDWINSSVKFREAFRPLAPVVLERYAKTYFDMDWQSPHMMYIVNCTELMRQTCPEGCHIDGTARVQTVPSDTTLLARILEHYLERSGIPVLLNTSLNLNEPIVETPAQAISTFHKMPVHAMWLSGWLITKKEA